jgi:hypothetical protein
MWWLKSPTFTASCTDESNSKYNADAHYWDNTHCQNTTDDDESTPTTNSGGFVAAGLAIVLITAGATIYGGKI